MDNFNTFINHIDFSAFRDFCKGRGKIERLHKGELFVRRGTVCLKWGYITKGHFAYTIAILVITICTFHVVNAQIMTKTDSTHFIITDMERFEGELFGGMALPIGKAEYGTKKMGWNVGGEVRYNFSKLPMDLGLQYSHVTTNASMTTFHQNSVKVTGDWNFFLPSIPKLTPFAGVGIGVSWCDGTTGLTAIPRVGVEYGDFVRLTFATQFTRQYYNNAQVSIGFVLGGRKDYKREYRTLLRANTAAQQIIAEPMLEINRVQGRC